MENVYKTIELTGSSPDSIEDAVRNALSFSSRTIRNMRWFQISDLRGRIEGTHIDKWQVTVKLAFEVDQE
ncbi:MAG: dodecin domain-containing protein [Fibrobacter sp.]|jgi:flavin-binding protein dodecin|nr:dodecin domain-containing protein [Fibrobacter sp.]